MTQSLPTVLVPGLAASPRLYAPIMPALWAFGPVLVPNHTLDDSMAAIAARVLAEAPPHFALAGHSMGGHVAFEIIRQAPERVAKLALIATQARLNSPDAMARRSRQVGMVVNGRLHDVLDELYPGLVHPSRRDDAALRRLVHDMGDDVGAEGFIRQQRASIDRIDSRPTLSAIKCPTLVLAGDGDQLIPFALAAEMADGIDGASLVVIGDAGHLPTVEQPLATTGALLDWLRN